VFSFYFVLTQSENIHFLLLESVSYLVFETIVIFRDIEWGRSIRFQITTVNYLGCQSAECVVVNPTMVASAHRVLRTVSGCYRDVIRWFLGSNPTDIGTRKVSVVALTLAEGH
jgi:hypothetical protein